MVVIVLLDDTPPPPPNPIIKTSTAAPPHSAATILCFITITASRRTPHPGRSRRHRRVRRRRWDHRG
ncbi:MAG: hypothetical protein ACRDTO_15080, partial [Mycobacterium sp.]